MGKGAPASSFTKAPERQGHPDPRSSLGDDPDHGLPRRVGSEPSGLVEWTQKLYELAVGYLESAISWSIGTLRMGTGLYSNRELARPLAAHRAPHIQLARQIVAWLSPSFLRRNARGVRLKVETAY